MSQFSFGSDESVTFGSSSPFANHQTFEFGRSSDAVSEQIQSKYKPKFGPNFYSRSHHASDFDLEQSEQSSLLCCFKDCFKSKQSLLCCIGTCSVCCIVVSLLFVVAFNVGGLIVGLSHQNATCYADQNIMSLSFWLVFVTSVSIASLGLVLLVALCGFCGIVFKNAIVLLSSIPVIILIGCSSIFSFIMNIIGIVELVYQFPSCKNEVQPVCIAVIIIVVVNTLGIYNSRTTFQLDVKKDGYIEV